MLKKKLPHEEVYNIDTARTRRRIEDALRKNAAPARLLQIAELLGVEPALLTETKSYESKLRPCFGPRQVRCVHQLKSGLTYCVGIGSAIGKVVREPFEVEGIWFAHVLYYSDTPSESVLTLDCYSVVPRDDGDWDQHNYILLMEDSMHLANSCCGAKHYCVSCRAN